MFKKYYILKVKEFYLCDINKTEDFKNKVIFNFGLDKDYRLIYSDFDKAEEDRKLILEETGINFEIKKLKEEIEKWDI